VNGFDTATSAAETFTVDTTTDGDSPAYISGDIWYMGRGITGDFVVQAFENNNFGQAPIQSTRLSEPGAYFLAGLRTGSEYYVRAFRDINGNGTYDQWEPFGLLKSPNPYAESYTLRKVSVINNSTGNHIVIRDVDTDNDAYSDAWEWGVFGDLNTATSGDTTLTYGAHSLMNGTALADLLPLDLTLDSDGDTVTDWIEILYGSNPNDLGDVPVVTGDLIQIGMGNGPWLSLNLTDDLSSLDYRIEVVTEFTESLIPANWQEVPGSRQQLQGTGPWNVNPGIDGTSFYRLKFYPLVP
jgi:hypothetical protein